MTILITGGTGTFGRAAARFFSHVASAVRIYSRDELKQSEMRQDPKIKQDIMRYIVGDVRDRDRLAHAMNGVQTVIHAAAMKQVPACEYNPTEAIATNIAGAENVIWAALANPSVNTVLAISTDKAVQPTNLYGATKLCAEKLFVAANALVGHRRLRFSILRYGNVIGSRGSVVPLWQALAAAGEPLPVTHPDMTRFLITIGQAVGMASITMIDMEGGEIFVPILPSTTIAVLARAVAPDAKLRAIGIRPGEKMHECLVSADESRRVWKFPKRTGYAAYFRIYPESEFDWQPGRLAPHAAGGISVAEGFSYRSDNAEGLLHDPADVRALLDQAGS